MRENGWSSSNRRSRLPGNWSTLRRQVLRRDQNTCQLKLTGCLTKATEVDHIIAGDNHELTNLQAACAECHKAKTLDERQSARAAIRAARFRKKPGHPGRLK